MSTERAGISEEKAEVEAEKVLRFDIGNLPHLGAPEYEDGDYVFPIMINLPRVVFDEDREEPVDVRYLSEEEIGEIRVDAESGDVVDRTNVWEVNRQIRQKRKEVDEAVQKALVKAEAEKFSLLPFPEHRYTPIQDLLSEVILTGQIPEQELDNLGMDNREKYEKYVETLSEVQLLRWQDNRITAGDHLIEIEAQTDRPSDALNTALAHFFEQGANNFDMIEQILGPYLILAGYYYRRSIESEQLPRISTKEFRSELRSEYTGKTREVKSFKLSRYLLQLESIEILESVSDRSGRAWTGSSDVLAEVLQQEEELRPISEIMA